MFLTHLFIHTDSEASYSYAKILISGVTLSQQSAQLALATQELL